MEELVKKEKYSESDLDNIKTDLSEFSTKSGINVTHKIGEGGFSLVYLGSKDRWTFAIKLIYLRPGDNNKTSSMAKSEIIITSNLKNKNCVRCYGNYDSSNSKVLVLDYAPNKDLSFLIHLFYHNKLFSYLNLKDQAKFPFMNFLSESFIRFFFAQILNALDYLRKMNFIHRDLKPENCLLTKSFQIKLSDFALSNSVPFFGDIELTGAGTGVYMPPESFLPHIKALPVKDAYKIDYYALGVILYKMLFNDYISKPINEGKIGAKELMNILDEINDKKYFYFNNYKRDYFLSEEAVDLLIKLIQKDYKNRIDLEDIKSHPWLKVNQDAIRFIYDIHDNDYSKFLIELQKMDSIKFQNNKHNLEINKSLSKSNHKDVIYHHISIRNNKSFEYENENNNSEFKLKRFFGQRKTRRITNCIY